MSTAGPNAGIGLTTISRTVASLAVEVVHTLERVVAGEGRVRTARGNAWEAVCADRARAGQRAELDRLIAELAAARVGLSTTRATAGAELAATRRATGDRSAAGQRPTTRAPQPVS